LPDKPKKPKKPLTPKVKKILAPPVKPPADPAAELAAKRELIVLQEQKLKLMEGLPFLYGWKWYGWAREFFESANKLNFLCAANQISKSSTQIRKCIDWATNTSKWPMLWGRKPIQFWYLYPTASQCKIEFETKWKQFLPRGEFKSHPVYGWKEEIKNKELFAIHFNSGVHVYFKTYSQDVQSLQTGTCDAIFCDEELPVDLYDELIFRISASDGYFHMVFTATLGQDFWKAVLEETGTREKLPQAYKKQVSMYDCQFYEDGTPSHWTIEKIKIQEARCKSHNEILRRVYGKFVVDEGRKYEQFDLKRHMIPTKSFGDDWYYYCGVDPGSGGRDNHPAAIAFVAVRRDFRLGYVIRGWRGDQLATTAGDIVNKFIEMRGGQEFQGMYYDQSDRDFFEISSRMEVPFQPADKSHDKGEEIINVLFKNNMLFIFDTPELQKLGWELSNLRLDTPKRVAKDDFADAMRYAITRIPWDWSAITGKSQEQAKNIEAKTLGNPIDIARRQAFEEGAHNRAQNALDEEIAEWAELY